VQNILPLQYGRSALRLTVARYYRPNGEEIHRAKDATEEDQWGVRPDDGMAIELDEKTIEQLAKRWREASYPAMAAGLGEAETDTPQGPTDGQTEHAAGQPEQQSGLSLDPQLKRAVDYIREKIAASQVTHEAA
jgi:carboxyl-terminal processing protease